MSFDHLAPGGTGVPHSASVEIHLTPAHASAFHNQIDHDQLKKSVDIQIFKINSNVQGIRRLALKIGTSQDTPGLRTSLANLTDSTRIMIEKSRVDVRSLAEQSSSLPASKTNKDVERAMTRELYMAISAFQQAQKLCAEKQKLCVEHEQRKLSEMVNEADPCADRMIALNATGATNTQLQEQVEAEDLGVKTGVIALQESLITGRERDIRDIETGIQELNEVFNDLNKIIGEQGEMIDNIENNVVSVSDDTRFAGGELTTAHEFQRKAGKRMFCLLLILMLVVTIVLVAVLL